MNKPHTKRVGRPSDYRPELCAQIIEAMATGLSAEAAAAKVGISARSLYYWQNEHPEFLQAVQEGRHRAMLWWETRALEMANGGPGNASIVSLALKNRSRSPSGWNNDSQRLEHTGAAGGPLQLGRAVDFDVSTLTPQERQDLRRLLLGAMVPAATV